MIPKQVMKALAPLTDPESTRYALGAVFIERRNGEPCAVATDGRKLLAVSWQEPNPDDSATHAAHVGMNAETVPSYSALIARKDAAHAFKVSKRVLKARPLTRFLVVDETGTNGTIPIGCFDGETAQRTEPRQIEGRFPAVSDAIPIRKKTGCISVVLNAQYLVAILKSLDSAVYNGEGFTENNRVTITLDEKKPAESPVTVYAECDGVSANGVIMPISPKQSQFAK